MALPAFFVSHGSPMHALDAGEAGAAWSALGRRLARPRAMLIASAHWETDEPALTGSPAPETIHDFYGFPDPLYRIRYAAPGEPALAERAQSLVRAAGFTCDIDPERGLDHGAWAPLLYLYPQADIPVVQISVQPGRTPREHYELGRALASLMDDDALVIGSGHMTHNLRDWQSGRFNGGRAPYAVEFSEWVEARIAAHEIERLCDYRRSAPHAVRAHPTEEHFLPLFVALGAAGPSAHPERVFEGYEGGVLAMHAYLLHAA